MFKTIHKKRDANNSAFTLDFCLLVSVKSLHSDFAPPTPIKLLWPCIEVSKAKLFPFLVEFNRNRKVEV